MAKEFRLPELGENIKQGTVGKLLVAVGDIVAAGQNVVEVETDKAVAEIPTSVGGKILEIRVKEGAPVKPGAVVLVVDESATAATAPASPTPPSAPAPIPTPAPVVAAPAPASEAPKVVAQPAAAVPPPPAPEAIARPGMVRAAPSVRQLARELGVDLNEVPTADPTGRISAQDIMAYHQRLTVSAGVSTAPVSTPSPAESSVSAPAESGGAFVTEKWGSVEIVPMNSVRRKTAEHMAACWNTIPHVTHFEKADITALEQLRGRYSKKVDAAGGKLTITSFVLKALPEALKRFPKFNASIDLENQQIVLRKYYHIGVAVDTPNGLLVPVLRDVDTKSVTDISVELPALAKKARDRKLAIEDMQGGTFTVSNLGGLGGNAFTPIINAPEVAILGMSRSQMEPVYINGQFVPRLMLPLSLSYDHRLIDGADAARFLHWLVELIENPWMLYLEN